jgi:hypothetical protein
MDEAKSQPWYQLYAAAVVELDPKQLIERLDVKCPRLLYHFRC